MEYVLLAVIVLIVVDGIYSPDGFRNIRSTLRLFRGIRGKRNHTAVGIPTGESTQLLVEALRRCRESRTSFLTIDEINAELGRDRY